MSGAAAGTSSASAALAEADDIVGGGEQTAEHAEPVPAGIGTGKRPRRGHDDGAGDTAQRKERNVVYWYSFSNPCTLCIHCGFSLVGNNLNNIRNTPGSFSDPS